MRRHWFLWLILIAYGGYLLWPEVRAMVGLGTEPGTQVPSVRVQSLDGTTYDTAAMDGQVVLINFWATWCPPCRTEMPGFETIYRDLHGEGFEILAISLDQGGAEPVQQFARELELTFPMIVDQQRVARAFDGTRVVPTSYLVDRQGRIREHYVGAVAEDDLRNVVEKLLREPAAAGTVKPTVKP